MLVTLGEKTKRQVLHEGDYFCPRCNAITEHALFMQEKKGTIYGLSALSLSKRCVLQCSQCNLQRSMEASRFSDGGNPNKVLPQLLKEKAYTMEFGLGECDKCGRVMKLDHASCEYCGASIQAKTEAFLGKKSKHRKIVLYVLLAIGVLIALQYVFDFDELFNSKTNAQVEMERDWNETMK